MDSLTMAKRIAVRAHRGQRDKSGNPYIRHPMAVAGMVRGKAAKIVALLHDVVEDTAITLKDLSKDFSPEIVSAIDAISRREGERYFDYVKRAKNNPLARRVKIADTRHNMSPHRRFQGDEGLQKRGEKTLDILEV